MRTTNWPWVPYTTALIFSLFLLAQSISTRAQIPMDSADIQIISNPESGYVIHGESFQTEILVLAGEMKLNNQNAFIQVNNKHLVPENGKVLYRQFARQQGTYPYTVTATIINGTDTIKRSQDFSFEVGMRCITVSADKMNVLYVGVDNPISVSVAGASSRDIMVRATGATITASNRNNYIVRVERPGVVNIHVEAGTLKSDFFFRAKAIPDPIPRLGRSLADQMESANFVALGGVALYLVNFDFDARCSMVRFDVVRIPRSGERASANNPGARFAEETRVLINKALPGDVYLFRNMECQCPGDQAPRKLQGFSVEIL